ncbi:MAG: nucleotidyl transferase AbiEii/AbiGii toxin family protein [Candidatus Magasanikbacteria bacterium]|nr:nucleotidyl transferase AbiEii/AbiGii toxin family protein [Candidatus Magasanikbacteria bacterium]
MLNKLKHQEIMERILISIYGDHSLRNILGFKGGTAAYLFYNLPRFSVDLDFNLLAPAQAKDVFAKLSTIVEQFGEVKDKYIKKHTIFLLSSYALKDHNIKIEVSTRPEKFEKYEVKSLFGFPFLVMEQSALVANKLVALSSRKKFVNRDLFDAYFFLKNNLPISADIIKEKTGKDLTAYYRYLYDFINDKKVNNILQGIGELVLEKQKIWIKENLVKEFLFLLQQKIRESENR